MLSEEDERAEEARKKKRVGVKQGRKVRRRGERQRKGKRRR